MWTCDDCELPDIDGTCQNEANHGEFCRACENLRKKQPHTNLTPLGTEDLELVLAWRSNPEIYRHFRNQHEPLEWKSHVKWFESRNPGRHDYIIHYEDRRVGVASIDTSDHVSVYLGDYSARGNGVATTAVEWLCERFESRIPIKAEVHEANSPSKRLFSRCGFERIDQNGEWLLYSYE